MPEYILAYHTGDPSKQPEDKSSNMEKWSAWVQGLGEKLVNPGTPLGASKLVSESGVEDGQWNNTLMGFSVVNTDSFDQALEIAKTCPYLEMGTIEVAEIKKM